MLSRGSFGVFRHLLQMLSVFDCLSKQIAAFMQAACCIGSAQSVSHTILSLSQQNLCVAQSSVSIPLTEIYFSGTITSQMQNAMVDSREQQACEAAVALQDLQFSYPGCAPFLKGVSLDLPKGSRTLLIGANGAGKTTMLQLIAGKYMVGRDTIRVLGQSPFYAMDLTCSGQLSYLGTSWRKDVAFAGYGVPLQGDITAGKMIFGVEGVDSERRRQLIQLLDIDLYQRLTTMSDGQKRRVQIAMGLLKPYDVLLLDEITVDMDVLGRLSLLDFFRQESEQRGATIIYATHIFDGLEQWITHVAYLEDGKLVHGGPRSVLPELQQGKKLLHSVEAWLRRERDERRAKQAVAAAACRSEDQYAAVVPTRTPLMPNKHLAFFR